MTKLTQIDKDLLKQVADMHTVPQGSFNIRKNGQSVDRKSDDEVTILPKKDKSGIDIIIKEGVKNKSIHIPVIITVGDFNDLVYNDFYIGKGAEVFIVAGCGIHNPSDKRSEHDGIHTFHLEENCKVKYIEKHLGIGNNQGEKILNPTTEIFMKNGSEFEMETIQLGGVSYSDRKTNAYLDDDTKLIIKEKILTSEKQVAKTIFNVVLKGRNSNVEVISRSVAKDKSKQKFISNIKGQNECFGHVECDGIILNKAQIESVPKIVAQNINATLIHEAAIGKIAGDQIVKLQTLGLSEEEAQAQIIKGFLK